MCRVECPRNEWDPDQSSHVQMKTIHKNAWIPSHQYIVDAATEDELIVPENETAKEYVVVHCAWNSAHPRA